MSLKDDQLTALVNQINANATTLKNEVQRLRNLYEPSKLKLAIPTYFYPGLLWNQLTSDNCSIAIINPGSGPGTAVDPNYVSTVKTAQAKGIKVLGYVTSSYGNKLMANFQNEVNNYYSWYGVDGIFIDEVSTATDVNILYYYQAVYNFIKAKNGFVVLNPGMLTNEPYINFCDLIITNESDFSSYGNFKIMGWETKYPPSKFWHLIYNCPIANLSTVMAKAKTVHAGYVYVTPDNLPNPWDTLPPPDYWNLELSLR